MLIRGTLTLRNEVLIAKREELGLTQKQAAEIVGCTLEALAHIERLDFSYLSYRLAAQKAAFAYEMPLECIMPEALAGKRLESKAVQVAHVHPDRLLAGSNPTRLMLPSPADEAEAVEATEALYAAMDKLLKPRERRVIVRRYGLEGEPPASLEDVGREIGVTRTRIRQIEAKAIRKLQFPTEHTGNPLAPFIRDADEEQRGQHVHRKGPIVCKRENQAE